MSSTSRILMAGLIGASVIAAPAAAQAPQPRVVEIPVEAGPPTQGALTLTPYSIHGYGPLVVLLTAAPRSASTRQRSDREALTGALTRRLVGAGFSVLALTDGGVSAAPPTAEAELDHLEATGSAALAYLRGAHPGSRPGALVGIGEGAVAAARIAARDSSGMALVSLAPSVADAEGGRRRARWEDLHLAAQVDREPRIGRYPRLPMLVLHSPCSGPLPLWILERPSH